MVLNSGREQWRSSVPAALSPFFEVRRGTLPLDGTQVDAAHSVGAPSGNIGVNTLIAQPVIELPRDYPSFGTFGCPWGTGIMCWTTFGKSFRSVQRIIKGFSKNLISPWKQKGE